MLTVTGDLDEPGCRSIGSERAYCIFPYRSDLGTDILAGCAWDFRWESVLSLYKSFDFITFLIQVYEADVYCETQNCLILYMSQ